MAIPTFNQLYDAARAVIESDPEHVLNDFSDGSWLDAFAGVAAGAAQGVSRYALSQAKRFFRLTAKGSDLDDLIADLLGGLIVRRAGESDDELNARVDEYLRNGLVRGTPAALAWFALNSVEGVEAGSVVVIEDDARGITTLRFRVLSGFTVAAVSAQMRSQLDSWRAMGRAVNLDGIEAV